MRYLTTPGAALNARRRRLDALRHAIAVARSRADDSSPYRAVEEVVEVPVRVARIGEVMTPRLRLECGHIVPFPAGEAIKHFEPTTAVWRRCLPCAVDPGAYSPTTEKPPRVTSSGGVGKSLKGATPARV